MKKKRNKERAFYLEINWYVERAHSSSVFGGLWYLRTIFASSRSSAALVTRSILERILCSKAMGER